MNARIGAAGRLVALGALVFVVFPAKRRWLGSVFHGSDDTVRYLIDHAIELAALLVFTSVMAVIERRPFAAFGLPWRQAFRGRFWQGAGLGLASLAVLMLVLHVTGALRIGASATLVPKAIGFGVAYALVFAMLAVREEFLYRGYGQFTLGSIAGFWPAAIVTTTWFTWTHSGNSGENWLGLANVAAFGLLGCLMLRRSGNLWLVIGFHAAWDWGQTYLFGVADSGHPPAPGHLLTSLVSSTAPAWLSGASVGPEGSVLCTVLVAILAAVTARWFRRVP